MAYRAETRRIKRVSKSSFKDVAAGMKDGKSMGFARKEPHHPDCKKWGKYFEWH